MKPNAPTWMVQKKCKFLFTANNKIFAFINRLTKHPFTILSKVVNEKIILLDKLVKKLMKVQRFPCDQNSC